MPEPKTLFEFADQLVETHTRSALSQVQRLILTGALAVSTRTKTYDQLATETGYSTGYIKLMASELWKLLSQIIGKKVTKGNVQKLLQQQLEYQSPEGLLEDRRLTKATAIAPQPLQPTISEVTDVKDGGIEVEAVVENPTGKPVILVVDDQPHNLSLLTDIMEDEYEVWQATSGAEALQMATQLLPDLILLDVNMPDMDGYAVCQQLKIDSQTTAIPIIFASVLDGTWNKVKGFSVGGSDYITKPFNTLEVIIRIENQLKIRQLQDQLTREAQAQAATSPEEMRLAEPMSTTTKAAILMVDDEPKNLALLTDVLEQDGYEVWQADSGSEALRIAGMVQPNLILLDIEMPDMNGYDVCQRLKEDTQTRRIPVIFVSILDKTWDKIKAFSVGGSDYIHKPIQIVELLARINHQLQIWRF